MWRCIGTRMASGCLWNKKTILVYRGWKKSVGNSMLSNVYCFKYHYLKIRNEKRWNTFEEDWDIYNTTIP